jgi:hypothetical protein
VLEDLPGAQGLQALRVTVAMPPSHRAECAQADTGLDAAARAGETLLFHAGR